MGNKLRGKKGFNLRMTIGSATLFVVLISVSSTGSVKNDCKPTLGTTGNIPRPAASGTRSAAARRFTSRDRRPPSDFEGKMERKGHGEHEIIFVSLIAGLLREPDLIPNGAILDVGAQFGEQAAHMAYLSHNRQVYAVDPSSSNVLEIQKRYGNFSNLIIVRAGMGRTTGQLSASRSGKFGNMDSTEMVRIETLDSLFGRKIALGLAHLDVEGKELDLLKGGNETISQNHPIITTEVLVHGDPKYTKDLLTYLQTTLKYDSYMVDEVCGSRMDYRNLINVPRALSPKLVFSDSFQLALAAEVIHRVTPDNIFKLVYPCCEKGGSCCLTERHCCTEPIVTKYLEKQRISRPAAMTGFASAREATTQRWYRLRNRKDREK